ncbi:3-dehydroquinate synthase [Lachnospiraceae bacterium KM106-2]|nr:3-dehydroquinate synthase [Lachnospiraceae bacterium KM106-2]
MQFATYENNQLHIHQDGRPIYDIRLESSYDAFYQELDKLSVTNRKVCIVCDSNTWKYYVEEVSKRIRERAKEVITFTFPAGEESKKLDTVTKLYETLIPAHFDRHDLLVALGGGVVGDLTGFAAATYLRGIDFIQLPTSLLAMVDSSIGGKTGVDLDSYKNMVGAFYQPKSVYINLNCLKTLTRRQYASGFGEVIKYGLINDKDFYNWLRVHAHELMSYDLNAMSQMVYNCCYHKQQVVEHDFTEQGERALLNLGHTIGHAIEKCKNFTLLHGECVAIGLVAAAHVSYQRGYLSLEEVQQLVETLQLFELPVKTSDISPNEVLQATKSDKKMISGKIKFIILQHIGNALIDDSITEEEMLSAIKFVID